MESSYLIIENEISEEYDYKLSAEFDGESFTITLDRNEFDLNKIPAEVFELEAFKEFPFRYTDFKGRKFEFVYSIPQLMRTDEEGIINSVKEIGEFKFNYTFMKMSLQDDSKETFFIRR